MDSSAITKLVEKTTGAWAKQRKAEERHQDRALKRAYAMRRVPETTLKDAAYHVMAEAYQKASANNTLPAAARQIMYAARPLIQKYCDKPLDDRYFTQTLLPNYLHEYPELTAEWDVVFDARGNFREPHTEKIVPLGTLHVRKYLHEIAQDADPDLIDDAPILDRGYPTIGPRNRISAILFIEKEGFLPLFDKVQLAARYDLAIMSTKGLSVTAARLLVDRLCHEHGVPLLILRDFDKAGFSIAATLRNDTKRYQFRNDIPVVDLGLRLDDVQAWNLEAEGVSYGNTSPVYNLRKNGATKEEIEFLAGEDGGLFGQRVELNAFASNQLIEWIESKLEQHGIQKVVPDADTLAIAYRRLIARRHLQKAIDEATEEAEKIASAAEVPADLTEQLRAQFEDTPELPWDTALAIASDLEDDDEGAA